MFIHPVHMIIALSALLAALLLRWAVASRRQKRLAAAGGLGGGASATEMRRLKERVQVLERIAVEHEDPLEREFERLRNS